MKKLILGVLVLLGTIVVIKKITKDHHYMARLVDEVDEETLGI